MVCRSIHPLIAIPVRQHELQHMLPEVDLQTLDCFWITREPRDCVSCKHGRGFMTSVHDSDPQFLTCHQDRRNVSTNQRENKLDAMSLKHLSHALTSLPRTLPVRLKTDVGVYCSNQCIAMALKQD